ncbi:septum site-determining protein Ssd [Saccharopolyspora taberi]|uniref:Rv3660c-like CheY-like N-terminal domain-containing protein n=1 Tax=Saccharopolyspora taberi TaxID=60895 RepID=A0ABN3VDF4_9PSEU
MSTSPLLITADAELAEDVLRLAAVSGCELDRAPDALSVGDRWRTAPLVVIDPPSAEAGAESQLPRRPGVLILARGPSDDLYRSAFRIGADLEIRLPADEDHLIELFAEVVDRSAPRSGRVLAVVGGCGGAGASVLATAVAVTAARRGEQSLLVDCDPFGGGLDLAVGAERAGGARWSGLDVSGGRVAVSALHDALPRRRVGSGAMTVLACDRDGPSSGLTPQAVHAVIAAGRRAGETVVCDLPRALSEPAVAGLRQADLTLVVVPAEVRACAAAARLSAVLRDRSAGSLRLVVRGPAASGLRPADVGRAVGVDVLTSVRTQPGLPTALDRGGFCSMRAHQRRSVERSARDVLGALESTVVGAS